MSSRGKSRADKAELASKSRIGSKVYYIVECLEKLCVDLDCIRTHHLLVEVLKYARMSRILLSIKVNLTISTQTSYQSYHTTDTTS